jgi:16S rRNA (guanine527-N7)-methyltransferase
MAASNAILPESSEALRAQLQSGCDAMAQQVSRDQMDALLDYVDLLHKWNKAYNLTAVRELPDMVTRHILDSLAIVTLLRGQRCIDVGSGAGLPGVPLAIMFPERQFHLLDSNGKKTRFLFQVKTALRLDNMEVHQARVESFSMSGQFDTVLSRAFASLQDMIRDCRHLLGNNGCFLAMKGAYPSEEIVAIDDGELCSPVVHPVAVPGLDEQRHLVEIKMHKTH